MAYSQVQLPNFLKHSTLQKKMKNVVTLTTRAEQEAQQGECIAGDPTTRFVYTNTNDNKKRRPPRSKLTTRKLTTTTAAATKE